MGMTDYQSVYESYRDGLLLLDIEDAVATITLNNPDRRNALAGNMHSGLQELLQTFNYDPGVRAVVIQGAGDKAFCVGADLKAAAQRTEPRVPGTILKGPKWLLHSFLNLEVPIVACINGDAAAFGATIALMCDITVMSESARIGDTHCRVGLAAGDGGPLIWPFLIGMNRAKEYLLTGRMLTSNEAKEVGLVNRVVPLSQVRIEARAIALELAGGAPLALKMTKAALNQQIWRQMIDVEHFALAAEFMTQVSEDSKEAAKAFVEKRKPSFKGR